ncbi:MAG: hypothetical protein ACI86M_002630 [Saprospiraceae bacterium]|jgi:hypothetical protein
MSKDQSASFMIRFTQKIYESEEGNANVQWRGKISHVQSGDNKGFVEFDRAVDFMQDHLGNLTQSTIEDKPQKEQEGILSKSFDMLRKFKDQAPTFVMDTIKDPIGQVGNIQGQIKEQIRDVSEDISQKLDVDNLRMASKSDYKEVLSMMKAMSKQIEKLTNKVDQLDNSKK